MAMQLGDKIESIRQSSHDMFRVISKIYSSGKVFAYLLEVCGSCFPLALRNWHPGSKVEERKAATRGAC
jgi:hypothetical protein